jgi:stage II sporulation protein D
MRIVRALLVLVLVLGAACTASPGAEPPSAPTGPTEAGPTGTGSSVGPSPTGTGPSPEAPAPTSVTLEPPGRGSFLVRGSYPKVDSDCVRPTQPRLLARYPGELLVERGQDGTLALTVTVTFDAYLEGIAEVPASWPMAALRAQAIAARSYALARTGWAGQEGGPLDEPICATSACQVYRGLPVGSEPGIERWVRAVRQTRGQVLLYEGRPAETLYFSTSNGQTYGNEEVFGSSPLPYLRPVVEADDGDSPLSRWSVEIGFEDLARFLAAAGEWPRDRAISSVLLDGGSVVVSGGAIREMDLSTFRDAANAWAHCLEPNRYPPGGLPTTIPSRWLTLSSGPRSVTVTGRGWGHGVGMVQWGAYGKATRGRSAEEILAWYYGGFRPEPYPEPGLIDVQVATGLVGLRVTPSRAGAVMDGEQELGRGAVRISGGEELTVRAG